MAGLKRFALVLVAASLFASSLLAQTNQNVRVLTYNIHRDLGGSDSNTASQPMLAKVVNYLHPDIWTINELGGNNVHFSAATAHADLVAFIHDQLTIFGTNPQENVDYYVYLSALNDGYDTVALVSRYPFTATATYSDTGGGFSALRGLARVSVTLSNGFALDVFTTHLKALNSTTDAEERQSEADTDEVTTNSWLASHHPDAVVLTGDWNESEDAGEPTNWSGHHIGDTLPAPSEAYHPITTMRAAGFLDPSPVSIAGSHDTIDSTKPTQRFDYTMYAGARFLAGIVFDTKQYTSAQLASLNAANGTSFVSSDSANASDHLPVLSIVRVGFAPEIQSVSEVNGVTTINFQATLSGYFNYTIEQSNDLVSWSAIPANIQVTSQTADTELLGAIVNSTASGSPVFYRVRATGG